MLRERTPTSTTSWNNSGHVAQDTNTSQPFTSCWRISSRVYGNHYDCTSTFFGEARPYTFTLCFRGYASLL
ncbi:unnamed protein product [Acanthoscelides obtectus]|uniref:Uncharacterized protein n=1 Tax=Acanthoscelides obtectus TaxID=200917 RepID=A0A9P0JXL0_ACAOB|nr:unnamed protein product [Acanthoscelides obtectus]CAK1628049.1 hypothetical protein AOBTE_LOCUS4983 [Acanthoscelides obtectus]